MHLKKLELSGFKSFAKSTVLEFPSKITAIVGPNGSGKSNIAESIRWVLGEQSMKSLRGKRGEDFIWNGSEQVPRTGKASVTLFFDNKDSKVIQIGAPVSEEGLASLLDFEEILIGRKIFRDGLNEYYLNDSQVRLKDVVELLARIGLGENKHNIIGQGEVDRILMGSLRERREILEEALGLRVYHIKKDEAKRKLEATENNMKQVEALVREISPHLRFLKGQAQKAEARGSVEGELKQLGKIYFAKEGHAIDGEQTRILALSAPFIERAQKIAHEIKRLQKEIAQGEEILSSVAVKSVDEKKLMEFEAKRREKERELGRLEGRLEVERQKLSQPKLRVVDMRYIKDEIQGALSEIRSILEEEDRIEIVRSHLFVLIEDLGNLMNKIEKGTVEEVRQEVEYGVVKELEGALKTLGHELSGIATEAQKLEGKRTEEKERSRSLQQKIREIDINLSSRQEEERDVALELQRIKFEGERLDARQKVFLRELAEAGIGPKELALVVLDGYEQIPTEEIKKKIERLRGKLEEIGGIDDTVVKEFQETETRHAFLTKELEDLKKASVSLRELVSELEGHIKNNFKEGFARVKESFHEYFRIIFGGGRASLNLVKPEVRIKNQENGEAEIIEADEVGSTEEGVDIIVDLPRKRIKGLAMLSGGERALTSIALLFAITAVNPPPFLVLDETDAALDEANSQRYGAILKELSKKTQLVLITHNRETMKSAGILYGVTMGDDGVSRLLSLKLEEAKVYMNR